MSVQYNILYFKNICIQMSVSSFKNNHLRLYAYSNVIIAKNFLRVPLWLLLLDFGNYHEMFLLVEFVFLEDGLDFGKQPNGIWRQVC